MDILKIHFLLTIVFFYQKQIKKKFGVEIK